MTTVKLETVDRRDIKLNRFNVRWEYRQLPLEELDIPHLNFKVEKDEEYLFVDGDNDCDIKIISFSNYFNKNLSELFTDLDVFFRVFHDDVLEDSPEGYEHLLAAEYEKYSNEYVESD